MHDGLRLNVATSDTSPLGMPPTSSRQLKNQIVVDEGALRYLSPSHRAEFDALTTAITEIEQRLGTQNEQPDDLKRAFSIGHQIRNLQTAAHGFRELDQLETLDPEAGAMESQRLLRSFSGHLVLFEPSLSQAEYLVLLSRLLDPKTGMLEAEPLWPGPLKVHANGHWRADHSKVILNLTRRNATICATAVVMQTIAEIIRQLSGGHDGLIRRVDVLMRLESVPQSWLAMGRPDRQNSSSPATPERHQHSV